MRRNLILQSQDYMNKTTKVKPLKIQQLIFKLNYKKLYKCRAFKFTKHKTLGITYLFFPNLHIAITIYSCLTFKLNIDLIFEIVEDI